jgi:hypothetical protein
VVEAVKNICTEKTGALNPNILRKCQGSEAKIARAEAELLVGNL